MNRPLFNRLFHSVLALGMTCLLAGCGGGGSSGPSRYEAHGKVTFKGAPVPYGRILFEPDSSQGNKGPGVQGTIENGSYVLKGAQGVISGPLRVRITGYDGIAPAGGGLNRHGKELFPQYSTTLTQPSGPATHDFEIKGK